jgi:hypothetical protein
MTTNLSTTIHVDSSMIDSATYNHENNALLVQFKSNKSKYVYEDVPGFVFHGLFSSESKGKFIHKNIIRGNYKFTRIK